jgi:hypothetical protein
VGDPDVVINWFPVVLRICFLLELLVGKSFLLFSYFHSFRRWRLVCHFLLGLMIVNFFFCVSRLPDSPLFLVTRFGCGLSFLVLCAESLTLLLISLVVFSVIIFRLMAFFC